MESIPFPLSTFHLAALNTMENINIYIYTYLYLCTYGGQIDLLVLDFTPTEFFLPSQTNSLPSAAFFCLC